MKLFSCTACQQGVFFENVQCTQCGHRLLYLPDQGIISAVRSEQAAVHGEDAPVFRALAADGSGAKYRQCRHGVDHDACNWAIPIDDPEPLCRSCRLSETIPDLTDPAALTAWKAMEVAKRRLLYSLYRLELPVEGKAENQSTGLSFVFKQGSGDEQVMTGHDAGVITINLAEAEAPFRERMRIKMQEPYRTLLGHCRHESGHYYWMRLVENEPRLLEQYRHIFGDERADYALALANHYEHGAPVDWAQRFVSAYASMHPWEDWAETWAHYLHMVDTLETARSYGMVVQPRILGHGSEVRTSSVDFDSFDVLLSAWRPLTLALNSLNRGMGLLDLYPFVLSGPAVDKMRFVHEVVSIR